MEIMTGFIFLSSKITAVGDCSHEFKGYLLLGRKADKPRQHIKKHRHYFADKGLSSQSYGFSSSHVWMWELDHKVEHWRIGAFEPWYWRRLLRVPWTARSNQSIVKEISPEYSLGALTLKLKLQDFGHLIPVGEEPTHWKRSRCGKDWRQEKGTTEFEVVGCHRRLNVHEFEQTPEDGEGQGSLACCSPWNHRVRYDWATRQQIW